MCTMTHREETCEYIDLLQPYKINSVDNNLHTLDDYCVFKPLIQRATDVPVHKKGKKGLQ